MLILALDTSSITSVALIKQDTNKTITTLTETTFYNTKHHAENLATAIQTNLTKSHTNTKNIDAIIVGKGPGPFTGLRAGIVTAKTLAYTWQKPLYGICSLDALAHQANEITTETEFLITTNAKRQEVYWAHYRKQPTKTEPTKLIKINQVCVSKATNIPLSKSLPTFGEGPKLYPQAFQPTPNYAQKLIYPLASHLGKIALQKLQNQNYLENESPLYLRHPDAKIPGKRKTVL